MSDLKLHCHQVSCATEERISILELEGFTHAADNISYFDPGCLEGNIESTVDFEKTMSLFERSYESA